MSLADQARTRRVPVTGQLPPVCRSSFQFVADDGGDAQSQFVLAACATLRRVRSGILPASAAALASCSASLRCRESLPRTTHQMSATNMPPMPSVSTRKIQNPLSIMPRFPRLPALPSCAAIVGTLWLAGCATPPPAPVPTSVPVPVAAMTRTYPAPVAAPVAPPVARRRRLPEPRPAGHPRCSPTCLAGRPMICGMFVLPSAKTAKVCAASRSGSAPSRFPFRRNGLRSSAEFIEREVCSIR